MAPAAGQGAIALESRTIDAAKFAGAFCAQTAWAVGIERVALSALGGGCHAASAAYFDGEALHIFHAAKGRAIFAVEKGDMTVATAGTHTAIVEWLRTT
jgi:porphobilinogen deaminase